MQRRNPRAYSHARQGEVALFLAIVDRYVTARSRRRARWLTMVNESVESSLH